MGVEFWADPGATNNLTVAEGWIGEGELILPEVHGKELHFLAPTTVRVRVRYTLSYSVTHLKILEDHTS